MRQRTAWLFGLLLCLPINTSLVQAQEVASTETPNQSTQNPPNQPTKVAVGVHLIDFDQFDEQNEMFKLDGYLFLTWQDRRLAFNSSRGGTITKLYKPEDVWFPYIRFRNVELARNTAFSELKVAADGTVYYKERFSGQFNSEADLKRFPFDSQKLKLVIESPLADTKNILLTIDQQKTGIAKEAFLTGWRIKELNTASRTRISEFEKLTFSELTYEINISRYSSPYIWNIVLPLLFIIGVSWTVFWSRSYESNTVIATSSLVAAIAFNVVIAEDVPKVAYLTFINGFILLIYIFICLVVTYTIIKHQLDLAKKKERAIQTDLIARWLVPVSFGISNTVLFLIFLI